MERLKLMWKGIVTFHNSRLIANLTKLSEEQYKANLESNFSAAKRLSDFIGLIIRWSFAQFAGYYFYQASHSTEFWLTKFVFGYCALMAFVVAIYMGVYVATLTLLYWASDVLAQGSRWMRYLTVVFSFALTGMLWFGLWGMVKEIARASVLPSP